MRRRLMDWIKQKGTAEGVYFNGVGAGTDMGGTQVFIVAKDTAGLESAWESMFLAALDKDRVQEVSIFRQVVVPEPKATITAITE